MIICGIYNTHLSLPTRVICPRLDNMNLNFEVLHILCICNSMFINQQNALISYYTFSNMFRFKLNPMMMGQ
jgi:hypothetical protein